MKEELEFGDIVIANRPGVTLKGHKTGPYIIVKVVENTAYVLYGTSKYKGDNRYYFYIDSNNHNMGDKISYYDYNIKKIDKDNIKYKIGTLDKTEINSIKRKLYIINIYLKDELDCIEDISPNLGDIIDTIKNKYVIINVNENSYSCLKVDIINNKYCIDYSEIINILKSDWFVLYDTFDSKKIKQILINFKNEQDSRKIINRGSVIKKDSDLYYVYNKENNVIYTFKIYSEDKSTKDIIMIHKKKYKTNFELHNFEDENLMPIDKASEDEIKLIKKQKKSYNKTSKIGKINNTKSKTKKKIDTGSIVINKTLAKEKYIVLLREGNNAYVVDYDEYNNGNIRIDYLNIKYLIHSGNLSNDKNVEILNNVNTTLKKEYGINIEERIKKYDRK